MFRTSKILPLLALSAALGASSVFVLNQPAQASTPGIPAPQPGQFQVQIRQPNWKTSMFYSEGAMRDFVEERQRHGWEVAVRPLGQDTFEVQYRLMRWGGTRYGVAPDIHEARLQQRQLDAEGFETRIVPR